MNHISDRARIMLKLLVERYIHDGSPVASGTLAHTSALRLSAASVRNVLADLDVMGFVRSPHTSAGRVPTLSGYRYFIDTLLTPHELSAGERTHIQSQLLANVDDRRALVQSASAVLASLTRMTAIVTLPRRDRVRLRQIEFLPLSGSRVLAILVVNQHEVENRILHMQRGYSAAELETAADHVNTMFAGRDLVHVREGLLREVEATRAHLNGQLLAALASGGSLFGESVAEDLVVSGETNLMGFQDLSDMERLRELFDALDHKRDMLNLFDRCLDADGVHIFVGDESGYRVLDECSVVSAPYTVKGQVAGVLGVIGPTRMAYSRVISVVDTTARLFSQALNSVN